MRALLIGFLLGWGLAITFSVFAGAYIAGKHDQRIKRLEEGIGKKQ